MQVRSVAAIPLSHPTEEGRSFGHARAPADARSATPVGVETAVEAVVRPTRTPSSDPGGTVR